ncbi:MAG: hypothetical protein AAF740_08535 [Bacteroidota bacterium]
MGKFTLTALLLALTFTVEAQKNEPDSVYYQKDVSTQEKETFFYLSVDGMAGNFRGAYGHLNFVIKESIILKMGYGASYRLSPDTPVDFQPPRVTILGLNRPFETLESYQMLIGKVYPQDEYSKSRFGFALGLAYTSIRQPTDFQQTNGGNFSSNYDWNNESSGAISLLFQPKMEWTFSRAFGLSAGGYLEINSKVVAVGISVGYMLGVVRKKMLRKF